MKGWVFFFFFGVYVCVVFGVAFVGVFVVLFLCVYM